MPRSKEQKKLFLELINKAKELYDSIKSSIKDTRTKINYSYLVNNSNNMNSIEKVIRELSLFKKYKGPVVKANLTKLKKQDHLLSNLNIKSKAIQQKYRQVLDVIGSKDVKILNTGLRRNKEDVIEIIIKRKMAKHEIEEIGTKISKVLKNEDGLIETSVRSDKWYYCGEVALGSNVKLFDLYDDLTEDEYDQTAFFISASPGTKGGNSKSNNCLYDCLFDYLGNKLIWKTPEEMRKFLKVGLNEKIDISYIEQIENKINIPINVLGNHTYISKILNNSTNEKVINLVLINQHYAINTYKIKNINIDHKVSRTERLPIIFNSKTYNGYDGKTIFKLTKQMINQIYHWRTDYILIKADDTKLSLEENYNNFVNRADILKHETNGEINLYKTGSNNVTALDLFNRYTKHIKIPPSIDQVESTFINNASQGALIFNTKNYDGPAYKADIKSMYPSIMKSKMLFPVSQGELKYLTEFISKEFFNYGIYRCIVSGTSKLFRFNFDNYYTHFDLGLAKQLGLDIKLIIDDQPNFLYYSRDKCLTGSELFGRYVSLLFDLKQKKINGSKQILNILWGSLCEKYKKDIVHQVGSGKIFDIPFDVKMNYLKPSIINDNEIIVSYSQFNNLYKYGYARIMPFLISKARKIISEIIQPHEKICIRCHTDGVIFKEEPKGIKYGDKLGDLVFEGYFENIKINKSGIIKFN